MKRRDLIRHLEKYGCEFLREGGSHTVYVNRTTQKTSTIPLTMKSTTFLLARFAKIYRFLPHSPRDNTRILESMSGCCTVVHQKLYGESANAQSAIFIRAGKGCEIHGGDDGSSSNGRTYY